MLRQLSCRSACVERYLIGGTMYDVASHANSISDDKFGKLSADSPAKKMTATTPVLFTPTVLIVVTPAALITAVGSV
jgi:hypothetical protein